MPDAAHIQIDIPVPCPEDWGQMTPCGQGRHCRQCDKTVVDFTTWTDAAIREFFSRSQEHVCGRYHVSQLGRPLHIPPQPHSHLYRMVVAMGLTLIFTQDAAAQKRPLPFGPQDSRRELEQQKRKRVTGRVVNENYGPLYGARVQILQNGIVKGVSGVDMHGFYRMPAPLVVGTYELDITYADCKVSVRNLVIDEGEWTYNVVFSIKDAPVLTKSELPPVDDGPYYTGVRGNYYRIHSRKEQEEAITEEQDSIGHLPKMEEQKRIR